MPVVTVKLPDMDADDCVHSYFRDGLQALEFAADCAETIDKSRWNDCVCHADGNVRDALNQFNEGQHFDNGSGLMGCSTVTISNVFSGRRILACCKGDPDWYKK